MYSNKTFVKIHGKHIPFDIHKVDKGYYIIWEHGLTAYSRGQKYWQ